MDSVIKSTINNCIFYYYDNKWQEPVITEKNCFELFKNNTNLPFHYFAFPWATLIDNNLKNDTSLHILLEKTNTDNNYKYFTVIQHIFFKEYIELLVKLNIKYIFSPHTDIYCSEIEKKYDIKIIPLSLYPAQNNNFEYILPVTKRKFLTNFVGQYDQNYYISNIREIIFDIFSNYDDCYIVKRNEWHYEKVVYNNSQTNPEYELEYKDILMNSRFTLCPSGSGPNSIRIWECMSFGSIPVILADTLILPDIKDDWNNYVIIWKEENIRNLYEYLKNMNPEKINDMSIKCIELYNKYFSNETMCRCINEYFESSTIF